MRNISITIVFLLFARISMAQISYVDINPDTIIHNNAIYYLDINSDGINDIKFVHEDSVSGLQGNGIGLTLLHYDMEFLGNNPPQDPSHFYPYKVDSLGRIDVNANGQNWVVKHPGVDVVRVLNLQFYSGGYAGQWVFILVMKLNFHTQLSAIKPLTQ